MKLSQIHTCIALLNEMLILTYFISVLVVYSQGSQDNAEDVHGHQTIAYREYDTLTVDVAVEHLTPFLGGQWDIIIDQTNTEHFSQIAQRETISDSTFKFPTITISIDVTHDANVYYMRIINNKNFTLYQKPIFTLKYDASAPQHQCLKYCTIHMNIDPSKDCQFDAVFNATQTVANLHEDYDTLHFTVRVNNLIEYQEDQWKIGVFYNDSKDVRPVTTLSNIDYIYKIFHVTFKIFNDTKKLNYFHRGIFLVTLSDSTNPATQHRIPVIIVKNDEQSQGPAHACLCHCTIDLTMPPPEEVSAGGLLVVGWDWGGTWYIYVIALLIFIIICIYLICFIRIRRRETDDNIYTYTTSNLVYADVYVKDGRSPPPDASGRMEYAKIIGYLRRNNNT